MKNLQKFAENQLSKDKMNNVKGGYLWHCKWEGGENYVFTKDLDKFIKQALDASVNASCTRA